MRTEHHKEYQREYNKKYRLRPEVILHEKEYRNRPEVKERNKKKVNCCIMWNTESKKAITRGDSESLYLSSKFIKDYFGNVATRCHDYNKVEKKINDCNYYLFSNMFEYFDTYSNEKDIKFLNILIHNTCIDCGKVINKYAKRCVKCNRVKIKNKE